MTSLDQAYEKFLQDFDAAITAPSTVVITDSAPSFPTPEAADLLAPIRDLAGQLRSDGSLSAEELTEITNASARIEAVFSGVSPEAFRQAAEKIQQIDFDTEISIK